jgi:FkbH-like protein
MRGVTASAQRRRTVKCVVWDLDNTVWNGVLLEGDRVSLRPGVADVIRSLDERGILNSIASRNDRDLVLARLRELGLDELFLCPQIGWNAKSASVRAIAEALNIGTDSLAFVDDEPYEREEVGSELPEVLCLDAADVAAMPDLPELNPPFVTEDSRRRRLMYLADQVRSGAEDEFGGPKEEFLAGLGMRLRIAAAREEDLPRAEELTVRTNQLNTTGRTYSYEELDAFRTSDRHLLLMASLEDRFGPYGNIGLALIECDGPRWTIRLLLMSCRVMSRGVGTILINTIRRLARDAGARLHAPFIPTGRNRMMLVTYKFNGFRQVGRQGDVIELEADLDRIPDPPPYVHVSVDGL